MSPLLTQLPIKLVLLAAGATLAFYLARARGTARASAAVKLLFLGFLAFGALAVLRPDDVSAFARLLGVGAGMNLLLYALVIAFAFTTVSTYLRFKELEGRYVSLARVIALSTASPPSTRGPAADPSAGAGTISRLADGPSGQNEEQENAAPDARGSWEVPPA
ncbi:hypothetical protein Srot_0118 [Segniliparus rotundus DSM 44985]|uniref:DUF2304 domain-containing protein n=1 Tax=Segniliparus rotundus (strain ATCC BAA-972 / CDC 1076 / CIP 108378 / DSM 44985 / JCM 13578) TaxID=640132 RepID=D6ZA67_SEGRD|nr:DUF2304 domain-containing protein [Segniliparus rotundus]ADG96609.1 hypothetical protein Srot_0118 [Segniliparus rotundus DSM 44985]